MVFNDGFTTLTSSNVGNSYIGDRTILRVSVPKAYTKKEMKELYDSIQEQVGYEFLPVIVPEGVSLEIVV